MKKLLVTLLAAITTLGMVSCGSGDADKKAADGKKAATISVQVEESWLPYYEKVKAKVLKDNPGSKIDFIKIPSFDHLDVIDATDPTNKDVADLFALPADRLYGLAQNQVLAPIDAEAMAKDVGGFKDFKKGLGGNLQVEGEYLAFPYNIETLMAYVNKENATKAGIDITKPIEFTDLDYTEMGVLAHDAWFGVAFTNSVDFELLAKEGGKLSTDATKAFKDLTPEQQKMFEALYKYWGANNTNKTDLWDKDAGGGYLDASFETGKGAAIRIDGPWASVDLTKRVGSEDNLAVIPLDQITVAGKPLRHWKGGWGLGINARCEKDEAKMNLAKDFIKETVNPANAKDLFTTTGKVLENATADAYKGVSTIEQAVIDATYTSYDKAVSRPLFTEYGKVWDSWQNSLLSWSATNPQNAEDAYNKVKASFEAMMGAF